MNAVRRNPRSLQPQRARGSLRRVVAARALFFAIAGLGVGCASGGVPLEEVSDRPIALVYWEPEAARRRQEIIEEMSSGTPGPTRPGVARVADMARVLGAASESLYGSRLNAFPGRIVLLNPRTREITPFPAAPPNARPLAWSADHRTLLFSSQHRDDGVSQLFEFDRVRGELKKLTHAPDFHMEGDYAPDGRLAVAYIQPTRGRPVGGLEVREAGGGSPRVVFEGTYPSGVRWSPKGDRLVYVVVDNREKRIESQRDLSEIRAQPPVAGAEVDVLARGREAVFSPDGEWLIFAAQTKQGWQLRRMRADGSARSPLGRSVRNDRNPAVSPDGRHVLYISQRDQNDIAKLYVRRIDGSGDRIVLEAGSAAFPVW